MPLRADAAVLRVIAVAHNAQQPPFNDDLSRTRQRLSPDMPQLH
jgi:hypothetical protein